MILICRIPKKYQLIGINYLEVKRKVNKMKIDIPKIMIIKKWMKKQNEIYFCKTNDNFKNLILHSFEFIIYLYKVK